MVQETLPLPQLRRMRAAVCNCVFRCCSCMDCDSNWNAFPSGCRIYGPISMPFATAILSFVRLLISIPTNVISYLRQIWNTINSWGLLVSIVLFHMSVYLYIVLYFMHAILSGEPCAKWLIHYGVIYCVLCIVCELSLNVACYFLYVTTLVCKLE